MAVGRYRADELLEDALERLDSYEVVAELASKPGFVTQLARSTSRSAFAGSGQLVVVKTIDHEFANRPMWERYAELACSHLPRVLDVIDLPDSLAVVLQYVEGESLESYVARHGALDEGTIISVMSQLCYAASRLAGVGIVHRDIKPSNIILSFDGVYLIDPGIARIATASQSQDTTILGSWGYAAPEQLGFAETDPRSDVFSLGRVLGFMATALSPTSPEFQHQIDAPTPNLRPWVEVWKHACAFDPAKRPQSAGELEREVLAAASRPATQARVPAGGPAPVDRPSDAPKDRYYSFEVKTIDERGIGGVLTQLDGPLDQGQMKPEKGLPRMARTQRPPSPFHPTTPLMRGAESPHPAAGEEPAPPMPGSRYDASSAGKRIAVVCVAAFTGLFALAFFITGLTGATPTLPRWLDAVYGLAMGILGNLLPGWEIANAILGRGVYEGAESPARLCLRRVLILWAICFAILMGTGLVNRLLSAS